MFLRSLILAAIVPAAAPASPVLADELTTVAQVSDAQCLSPSQRRSVAASGKVVSLAKAIRAARAKRADVVDAKLCKGPKGLVYVLTVLAHDGKVTRATVDAASGVLTGGG